ncbi:Maf family protein [Microbulbifer sp. SA54]|uniref:Maf family protein n=1 Tax=Microbulbifer sp. SA54 TaxID=3401577 RepID=UPI003AAE7ACA
MSKQIHQRNISAETTLTDQPSMQPQAAYKMRTLILASSSNYRKTLLERLGLPFRCQAPHINEEALPGEDAITLACRLAREKAAALKESCPAALIIGSDQVAECAGRLLGKPGSTATAEEQLSFCSGKRVNFHTGLSVLNSENGQQITQCETYSVLFRPLTSAQISFYVAKEKPLDCAGSFKAEGLGIALFEKMEGSDPNSLVGLPLIRLVSILAEFGVSPLDPPNN